MKNMVCKKKFRYFVLKVFCDLQSFSIKVQNIYLEVLDEQILLS